MPWPRAETPVPVTSRQYPVNLNLEGQPCLVVGGGAVAARKAAGLVACGANVSVIAAAAGPAMRALGVPVDERPYRSGDVAGYRLVIAATNDGVVNRAVFDDSEAAGIWVNSADDPVSCTFTLPAVVRRGPIMITVSTGGHSPALSSWLKGRVEEQLGPEYEELVALLSTARNDLRAAGRSTEEIDWRSVLDSDMLEHIKAGRISQARERLRACLSLSSD
jgi:precorrin-2 dehydrogenase / sirohydrochlorin ferrochelatase